MNIYYKLFLTLELVYQKKSFVFILLRCVCEIDLWRMGALTMLKYQTSNLHQTRKFKFPKEKKQEN